MLAADAVIQADQQAVQPPGQLLAVSRTFERDLSCWIFFGEVAINPMTEPARMPRQWS